MAEVAAEEVADQFVGELVNGIWHDRRGARVPTELESRFVRFVMGHASEGQIENPEAGFAVERRWEIEGWEEAMSPFPFDRVGFRAMKNRDGREVPVHLRQGPSAGVYFYAHGENRRSMTGIVFEQGRFQQSIPAIRARGREGRSPLESGVAGFALAKLEAATLVPIPPSRFRVR